MDRRFTAWKKNRKFGDIHGGRTRLKLCDNIFSRCHSLKLPTSTDVLPILIEENPSRDFFFPISVHEANEALQALPKRDYEGITHIWCRRAKKSDHWNGELPLAAYIKGSGVKVVILYPWPKTRTLSWRKKPGNRQINEYNRFGIDVHRKGRSWQIRPTTAQLQKLYIELLLYHEVGHHIDLANRAASKAEHKRSEEFADQYAIQKSVTATYVFNRISKRSENADG